MNITMADVHSWFTALQFAVFIGIIWWAYGAARKGRFEEAARLALDDDDGVPGARPVGTKRH